jgi:diguanylate cyclase (GGDEF)-like protein
MSDNHNKEYKNPLSRSVVIGCIAFSCAFALAIGLVSYVVFNRRMLDQYRSHVSGIANLTLARIDAEDLEKCIETGQPSEKFEELITFMDEVRVSYGLESITIVRPEKNGDRYDVKQVASGLFPEERAGSGMKDIPLPLLGDYITDFLPPGFPEKAYNEFISNRGINYTQSETVYGRNFDATVTIRDARDNPVAYLVTSVSLQEIDSTMRQYILIILGSALLLSAILVTLMILWLRRRVIRPIKRIGLAAEDFAERSRGQKDPDVLILENKAIHTGDEMEALADTLVDMSRNMKSYVEDLIQSAVEIEKMKVEVDRANYMAMRDSLTGVKNKAAYDQQQERLNLDIAAGDAEFGIIMIDINNLKRINDNFGHDKGNIFIKKMCTMICDTFTHSPVFRVGGDEFIVVLIHRDYENREALIFSLKTQMDDLSSRNELDEWLRPTAAIGLAIYDKNQDKASDTVLKRADEAMYENKRRMKKTG